MAAEVKRLARRALEDFRDIKPHRLDEQTLVYPFDEGLAWVATRYLRTPSRALWELYDVEARRLEPLFDEVQAWIANDESRPWLFDGMRLSVRARDIREFPASASQLQGTVKNAIIEGAARRDLDVRLDPRRPDVHLEVRGTGGQLVVAVDLAGRGLHARGYRTERTEAPLRENLAAQVLMLARWDVRSELLLDPMTGSGTFAIEGACMARGRPLWAQGATVTADRLELLAPRPPAADLFADADPFIVASDIDEGALRIARKNARRADVRNQVVWSTDDFRDMTGDHIAALCARRTGGGEPPRGGLVVCNPPYGERLEADADLSADLGRWWRSLGPGWRAAFLVPDRDFPHWFGAEPKMTKPMANGPLKTTLFVFGE